LDTSVNVLVSVLATATSVPGGQYGLTCRGGPDTHLHLQGKGYAFVLEGSAAILEKVEFPGDQTHVYPLATSQHAVPIRNGAYLLQASCRTVEGSPATPGQPGKTAVLLRFWVNGEEAASYRDSATPFTSGYVGVVCLTDNSALHAIHATFDRFGVHSVKA
jgi:hypothetical protein